MLVLITVGPIFSGGGNDKYVKMVKNGTLEAYPQMTVGEAFDGYLSKPKWESGISEDDERFVNVKGGIKYYDKDAELAVQFFITDEKEGSFEYHACEINGVPQNNFVVLGLFETIYGEEGISKEGIPKEADTDDDPISILSKIEIGETKSYDDIYGNIEVTLGSVEFVDKYTGWLMFCPYCGAKIKIWLMFWWALSTSAHHSNSMPFFRNNRAENLLNITQIRVIIKS